MPAFPTIPGFTILSLAGQGGMGAVYKAEQASPRRTVALKLLRRPDSAEALEAFRREAQVIAGLEHPYIVPLYGFGEYQGAPYLTLRYLDGGTVADRIAEGPIELKTAARWLTSIADALDVAHKRDIIHRDIKPSNMLLDNANNAYLADFGIAGATESAASGAATGSAAYMPPEQGRGEAVDARSDIYSLAVALFEMLTGQKPYTAETALGVIVRHLNDPIPSAQAINPSIPKSVDALIRAGMAKDPADRPQTATEFSRLLQRAVADPNASISAAAPVAPATIAVPSPTLVGAVEPSARKTNPLLWIVVAILVFGCIAALVVTIGSGALAVALLPTSTVTPTITQPVRTEAAATPTLQASATPDPDGNIVTEGDTTRITINTRGFEFTQPLEQWSDANVAVEATVVQEVGPNRNEMALICRMQDQNNYVALAISGDGAYSIWARQNSEVVHLIDWTLSDAILQGEGAVNLIHIVCNGPALSLEVNGTLIATTTDPNPIAGDVAVLAGLRDDGQLIVAFSDVEVGEP